MEESLRTVFYLDVSLSGVFYSFLDSDRLAFPYGVCRLRIRYGDGRFTLSPVVFALSALLIAVGLYTS